MSNFNRKVERNHLRLLVGNRNMQTYWKGNYISDQQILRAEQRKKEQIKKRKEKEEKSKLQSE